MLSFAQVHVRLLEAALSCFAAEGFEATTMARIAEKAGVPLNLASLHYPSKHAFTLATYQGVVSDVQARLTDLPRATVAERFASLMEIELERLDAHRDAMRALITASLDPSGPAGILSGATAAIQARMSGAVHAAVVGATDAPADAAKLSRLLYGVHLAIVLLWTQDADGRMARAMVAVCRELLLPLLPVLSAPPMSDRLNEVLGDRFEAVATADVERRARWVLMRLMHHRRLLPGVPEGPPGEEALAPHLPLVRAALIENRPLEFVLPAFPAKSPNPLKVLGRLPDMAERVALSSLQALCEEFLHVHPAGVCLHICSDGLFLADVVGVTDEEVRAYGKEIDRILEGLPLLRRFDLSQAFGATTPKEARRRLLAGWAETDSELLAQACVSPSLGAQLDGLHRFMFEDGLVLSPEVSRSQVRKHARQEAAEILLRSRAWGRLLATLFPHALRLSIHPQPAVSDKLGIHLLSTQDAWLTPWHGVALLDDDRFRLLKRSEAEAMGALPVEIDGRPSHYVLGR